MSFMMAFGWAGIMLLVGFVLRATIPFLRNMLVPTAVIAGILGLIFINVGESFNLEFIATDTNMYTDIVNYLFTFSFISIGLTATPKEEGNSALNTTKGGLGMGLVWCFSYSLTPIIGALIVLVIGVGVGMDNIYGMLITFAFTQGPGQAASYGAIFEMYGWQNAVVVGITFAAIGFLVAFLVGVPAAKFGIRRGLAKHFDKLDDATLRGYLKAEEQTAKTNRDTTVNSNIETTAFHFALIGLCWILAVGISFLWGLIPSYIGSSMAGIMFFNGMIAAMIIRVIMTKAGFGYLLDNALLNKITSWSTDYLIVCAFMAISLSAIGDWLVPILVVAVVITAITFLFCFFFGQRFGGSNDFERTLAIYGMCTGTTPTGIALSRIVDPMFRTATTVELGIANLVMVAATPTVLIILGYAAGELALWPCIGLLAACSVIYLVIMKICRVWVKPTYRWKGEQPASANE